MKRETHPALCQATATLLGGNVSFANDYARKDEKPVETSVVDAIEVSVSRYRPEGCGLRVRNVADHIASCVLYCDQVETGGCPLLIVGLSDAPTAKQLGIPHRGSQQDFDFVA